MRKRRVGRTTSVTEIGLGTAQLGNLYAEMSDETAGAIIDSAWSDGIRYFDTAPHYGLGLSERRLGHGLAERPRAEFSVSTKVGRLLEPHPAGTLRQDDEGFVVPATHRRVWDFSRNGIRRSIEDSLNRLQLDRIDIAFLHDPDDHWSVASTAGIAALQELRDEGIIDAIGVGMNQADMPAGFIRETDIDVVLLAGRYTLLDQSGLTELLPLAQQHGVAVIAAGVFNSGLLASEVVHPSARYDYRTAPDHLVARAAAIAECCSHFGVTLPEAAIAFALRHPAVSGVVLGADSPGQIDQAVARASVDIPEALWATLHQRGLIHHPQPTGVPR